MKSFEAPRARNLVERVQRSHTNSCSEDSTLTFHDSKEREPSSARFGATDQVPIPRDGTNDRLGEFTLFLALPLSAAVSLMSRPKESHRCCIHLHSFSSGFHGPVLREVSWNRSIPIGFFPASRNDVSPRLLPLPPFPAWEKVQAVITSGPNAHRFEKRSRGVSLRSSSHSISVMDPDPQQRQSASERTRRFNLPGL